MGSKSSAPPAPDYTRAAEATAAGNLESARYATAANRVNQYGPQGSITYSHGTGDKADQWSMHTNLSPDQQQIYNQNTQISKGLLGVANTGLGAVNGMMADPGFDESKLPQNMVNAGQTGQDAIMARLNPQFDRSEAALRTQLANQGITPGSEAYSASMGDFNRGRNDAYSQAALQGISIGQNARAQSLQEQTYVKDRPLNVINALRTGNQLQAPVYQQQAQQATTGGANYLGAQQATYDYMLDAGNAKTGGQNAMMGGLFNMGAAYLGSK